jgi:hypothetical protein
MTEVQRSYKLRAIAVFVFVFAVGLQINARPSAHPAIARQLGVSFCQITDAHELAGRAGQQSPGVGINLLASHWKIGTEEVVKARLANFSDATVRSGAEFEIQRHRKSGWQTDPSSPDGPWPRSARKVKPGEVGGCYRYVVPRGQPAGRYRFLTTISQGSRKNPEVAQFMIRGHAG